MFIPTWNVETWLAYLSGETVDEANKSYPKLPRARDCKPLVEELFKMCQAGALRQPAPASLVDACQEYATRMPR